jgi:hypothetical protein
MILSIQSGGDPPPSRQHRYADRVGNELRNGATQRAPAISTWQMRFTDAFW